MKDNINPSHYQTGGIQTIDYIQAKLSLEAFEGFLVGNILKYITRFKMKNGLEDVKKAEYYLNKLKETLETNKQSEFKPVPEPEWLEALALEEKMRIEEEKLSK